MHCSRNLPPPCIFNARTVATKTTTLGVSPEDLPNRSNCQLVQMKKLHGYPSHFMLKNFSMPISAPNPASVTT